ncbi:MAG TPA: hypothetical protein G4O11_02615 [Anaerolineae bacterium]|nr:hypothetical protein [Anaerolineae bacterium]
MRTKILAIITILVSVGVLIGIFFLDPGQSGRSFDLEKLLIDVFDPQAGETVLIMVDLPHGEFGDYPGWQDRRQMAQEWHDAFNTLAEKRGFTVLPLYSYRATGVHSGAFPERGFLGGKEVVLDEVLTGVNIAVALTEYSPTAPLIEYRQTHPDFRAASMPIVHRGMQSTALSADYSEVARKAHILRERLDKSLAARVIFSSGHEFYFDLRYREAHADDGQLHAGREGMGVINLPSGEAYIVPYEGERPGEPSQTAGEIPFWCGDGIAVFHVEGNRIQEVAGESPCAEGVRSAIYRDEGLRNVAELGLGVNEAAVVTGNVLEDEKVFGMHWAFGLSEALGGVTGADDFEDPDRAYHRDLVYPKGGDIEVSKLTLEYEDGTSEVILSDGKYTLFRESLPLTQGDGLLVWMLLTATAFAALVWRIVKVIGLSAGQQVVWALATVFAGPFGYVAYRISESLEPEAKEPYWQQALRGATFGITGVFAGGLLMQAIQAALPALMEAGLAVGLGMIYFIPLLFFWIVFAAPWWTTRSDEGYGKSLLQVLPDTLITTNLGLAGSLPMVLILANKIFTGYGTFSQVLFVETAVGMLVGGLLIFVYSSWKVRRGYATWTSSVDDVLPGWQQLGWLVAGSLVIFIAALVCTLFVVM